ncbi:peptide chain release factor N(5)-glutamine methyltransferase [Thermosulfurimonas marina]|uniref:Release factor glutamine methyltransferase n=1 Tax=Thermosulfurimonas marina TaxID=2047767 RepID=A0A6H1WTH8_9BACT|nr:peptide chain release factor N(5)-glutamine methyltransferase [Thermosulfurimonas marina]QJA06454.1 peptide chain release factor N(5)-glutamine methyltransferase [Thermosulfurimonas marina]
MRVREALALGKAFLVEAGLPPEKALAETRALLAHLLEVKPLEVYLHLERGVPEETFRRLLEERARGIPLAYLLGEVEFYGRTFSVKPGVLIPRAETEILVEAVLSEDLPPGPVLELGVGSGVVLITLLLEGRFTKGIGVDRSRKALSVARENVARYRLEKRVLLVQGDWLSPLKVFPAFAALVSNPPYVSRAEWEELPREVREYEPREALDGGPEGLDYIRRTLAEARRYLRPGGKLFLEIGYNQRRAVEDLAAREGWQVKFYRDLLGYDRVGVFR